MDFRDIAHVHYLLQAQAYPEADEYLRNLDSPSTAEGRALARRLRAWVCLALGQTERAYDLFWRCADTGGGRAGILVLTVLAGQVTAAMENWQRFCQALTSPPLELPDAELHARPVALAAIAQLQRYPFTPGSSTRGAAGLYCALLHRALGDVPAAFIELSKVADFYPPADLVRDRWLEEVVCLPAPVSHIETTPRPRPSGSVSTNPPSVTFDAEFVVQSAARVLLYPDLGVLEKQCQEALASEAWNDALEILRRQLQLDPGHTPSLEKRWRLHLRLGSLEAAKADLFALVDLYEARAQIVACQESARQMADLFGSDERALLKMCFLQSRLAAPLAVARYGRQLLRVCREQGLLDRFSTYRLWLLRQDLSLDDRGDFEKLTPHK